MLTEARPRPWPLLAALMVLLLFALWSGLVRLGWSLPDIQTSLVQNHGPLMVSGFLGTLIILERVVALRRSYLFIGPVLTAIGGFALIFDRLSLTGPVLITVGSLGGLVVLGIMVQMERRIHTLVMMLGVLSWVVGNALWLAGWPIFRVVLWWVSFLVLTITGERIELSRVRRITAAQQRLYSFAVMVFLAGLVVSIWYQAIGVRIFGAGLLMQAAWLLIFDVAPRNIRHPNALTRYIAWCLLPGYLWLILAGTLVITNGVFLTGLTYDAVLHAIFLGFVMTMIFGHAPIILPGVLQIPVAYRPTFYAHLVLLHLSLVMRIAGDLLGWIPGRKWGGMFNVLAVLLFLGQTAYESRKAVMRKAD